jgi:hypothetical protein
MTRAGAVSVAHGAPLGVMARRARTRRPWREVGRPRPCVAFGDDRFPWYPGECVLGLPGGGSQRAPTGEP